MLFAAAAWADPIINVTFPEKGAHIYWLDYADTLGESEQTTPMRMSGKEAEIDLAPAAKDGKLMEGKLSIYDPKTGNMCSKSLESLQDKTDLKLKEKDFDMVRTVRITLHPQKGKPDERVQSAIVKLTDANSDKFTALVDPSSEGVAEFHDIAGGTASIEASFGVDDKTKTMTLDMDIPLERDNEIYTDEIAVSYKVPTIKISAASSEEKTEDGKKTTRAKRQPAPSVSMLQYFLSLALLVMIAFIIYVVLKSKGTTFQDGLKKLGVQFPQDADAGLNIPGQTPEPQADPNVCQFCGQRKDANGKCSCTIDGHLPGPGMASSGTSGIPRLIGVQGQYAGHIFEITGDEATLGRDAGNIIPLVDDSTSSRRHARIAREGGAFSITDEGSSNGTFVNGTKITGRQILQPGDEVQIGSTKFRFEV